MREHQVIERYSKALFGLAQERGELDRLDQEFILVKKLVAKHPEISHLVLNSTISRAEKEDFISKIVPSEVSKLLLNFMKVLIRKKRFRELSAIQETFHACVEKSQNIQEVHVISARNLLSSHSEKLQAVLKHKLKSQIRLTEETDPSLIGGLIIRFNGTEIDASFKNRLLAIRQQLMAR